jgi:hypothetical protein
MKQVYKPAVKKDSQQPKSTSDVVFPATATGRNIRTVFLMLGILAFQLSSVSVSAQNCAVSGTDNVKKSKDENTYYPGTQAAVAAGATTVTVGAAGSGTDFGSDNIQVGDILLIIQMQGAQITVPGSQISAAYGDASGTGRGFTSTNLYAGKMEFAVAAHSLSTSGGTLQLTAGLTNAYKNSAYGTNGQYSYQIILLQQHYNIKLTGDISTPQWNGSTGGVTVLSAVNDFNFNGHTIDATGAGFRGGGGRRFGGESGSASDSWKYFYAASSLQANGSKGEGIAGTPRYLNYNNALKDNLVEGYPSGSYGRGAPGNAGGGATDSNPVSNDQNAGGGGGGNGGIGGQGGNGWSSHKVSGGIGGAKFNGYYSPSRLIMGGGGGAGSTNDASGTPGSGFASSGSAGGGMVIINAISISGTGTIDVSGLDANSTVTVDGSGGGGAGGSILIYANSGQSGIKAYANGGHGGDNYPGHQDATQHGPGGGGGGGVIYSNGALNAASSVTGGIAGVSYGNSVTDDYGAVDGTVGIITTTVPSAQLPPNMRNCQSTILPVSILDFSASYTAANNVKIAWSTTDEVNAAYFEVERSTNGEDFIPVGQVNISQSTNPVKNYGLNDQLSNINSNIVYYRLRIVDQSGKFAYSKVVAVKLNQPETSVSVYPNPVDNYTILNLYSDKQAVGVLRLMDNSGRQLLTKSISVNTGNNSIMVDQLGYLPKGMYVMQVMVNNNLYNQKLLKK